MKRAVPVSGMSLIEVVIALALTTMIAGLMGGIMRWYVVNQTRADYTYEELRMARAVLGMIADDVRCVLRNEPLDTKPLTALLQSSASSAMGGGGAAAGAGGSAGGGGAGGGGSGGASGSGGDDSGDDQSGTGGGGAGGGGAGGGSGGSGAGGGGAAGGAAGGMSSVSSGSSGGSASDSLSSMTGTGSSTLPPGVYGTETLLEVDISRVPRVDEAIIQQPDIMSGALSDLPTDVKTVSYYIQGNVTNGVQDSLSTLSSDVLGGGSSVSSGLVRRIIARNVLQHAYTNNQSQQVMRTGTIISRDVVGLDFQYFDGTQWYMKWDSSTQGVPRVVRVSIAMQNPTTPINERMTPPISLTSVASTNLVASGITIYSTVITIPGAALSSGPASADSASSAMGLTQ